jgi:hypothetical protein
MAQISRPYQIALAAMAVLALVWFVALHGHAGGSSQSSPSVATKASAPAARPSAGAQEREAAKATPIYKGAAPGVEGLTRDIARAHGAVATSQRNAAELQRRSAQASDEAVGRTGPRGQAGTTGAGAGAHKSAAAKATVHPSAAAPAKGAAGHDAQKTPPRPSQQAAVERDLAHGKTVLLLFWNPASSVDRAVRSQAMTLAGGSKGKVAVHVARASQVGLFGPVTEVAHVYQTPTVLIVARPGLVTTLTGLVDSFGLQQAVREAERSHK